MKLAESEKLEKISIYEDLGYSQELIETLLNVSQEKISKAEESIKVFGPVTGKLIVESLMDDEESQPMTIEEYRKWSSDFFRKCKEEVENEKNK